jgi:hypothetical protein
MSASAKAILVVVAFAWVGCEGRAALRHSRDGGTVKTSGDAGQGVVASAECPSGTSPRLVEVGTPVKLDLLFMIDDSPSMEEEQANLARNFPLLMEALEKLPAGLPDLHLGVVSSDMGVGAATLSGACGSAQGDRGALLVRDGCGLDAKNGRFLIAQAEGAGNNFTGDISDVFACLAKLGTGGCGFEHQLQAARMALSGFVPDNAGFLRSDAHLAVVYITDEDDCSAPADATFYQNAVSGQDGSLRCSLVGHLCDGQALTASEFSTPLDRCSPAPNGGGKLIPVQTFIDEMQRLRTQSVSVSVIAGWPADPASASYAIGYDPTSLTRSSLGAIPICSSANGKAAVGLRLKQFVDAFGAAGKIISICQDDFSDAMAQIGELINTTIECQ